jgi:hypothetical protein
MTEVVIHATMRAFRPMPAHRTKSLPERRNVSPRSAYAFETSCSSDAADGVGGVAEVAMSYVVAVPEFVASAASDLAGIGSGLSAAHAVAAGPTTAVVAAAGDEVSAAIASLFSGHGQAFQSLSARAAAFHGEFVQAVSGAGGAYSLAEAANVSPLQTLEHDVLAVINTPTDLLLGRPLIGKGINGAEREQGCLRTGPRYPPDGGAASTVGLNP